MIPVHITTDFSLYVGNKKTGISFFLLTKRTGYDGEANNMFQSTLYVNANITFFGSIYLRFANFEIKGERCIVLKGY